MLPVRPIRRWRVARRALSILLPLCVLAPEALAVPVDSAPPTLSGVVAVGSTVTCTPGTWTGNGPLTRSYRWVIDGRGPDPYVGTGPTYEPAPADQGWPLQCEETVTDADDTAARNSQAQTILPLQPLDNVSRPTLSGSSVVGSTLTCDPGTWSRTADYAYQWLRDGTPITGSTAATRLLTGDDVLQELSCRVAATARVGGDVVVVTSLPRTILPTREIPQPGKPTITGTARVGETLTCNRAAGSEEYQHEWRYASGAALEPRVFDAALAITIALAEQTLVCVASISNIDGYRAATSDPVTIAPFRRPTGITDFPVFDHTPLGRYFETDPAFKVVPSALSWRAPQTQVLPPGDVRVTGIEVTPGTQYRFTAFGGSGLPNRCTADPTPWVAAVCPPGQPVRYAGVRLAAGRPWVARVFVDRAGVKRTTPVQVRLIVRTSAGAIIGTLIKSTPLTTSVAASALPVVTDDQRRDPGASVNFEVPAGFAREGSLQVEADVVPQEEACPSGDCTANNRFLLVGIPVWETGTLRVATAQLTHHNPFPPAAQQSSVSNATFSRQALTEARRLLPVRSIDALPMGVAIGVSYAPCLAVLADPFMGPIAATNANFPGDCRGQLAHSATSEVAAANPGWAGNQRRYDVLVGVSQTSGGYMRGLGSYTPGLRAVPVGAVSGPVTVLEAARQRLTVAHELVHNTGIVHASAACGASITEPWPPDERGRLQGIGWDAGKVLYDFPRSETVRAGDEYYDLMSYCASESNAWVSPRNWDRMVETFAALDARARAATVGTRQARTQTAPKTPTLPPGDHVAVSALLLGGRASVLSVKTGPARTVAGEPSGYLVRAVDAGGAVLAESEALLTPAAETSGESVRLMAAQLPAAAVPAAKVEIVARERDALVGGLERPATRPSVRLRPIAVRARSGKVSVRWRSERAKSATVFSSVDGGRSWRLVWSGAASPGRAELDARAVPRSQRAKVRVQVSDGWNQSEAVSRAFASPGAAPALTRVAPRRGTVTIRQGERLSLKASAIDDAARLLTGSAVRWLEGGQTLATGESPVLPDLAPGRHALSVVARDRHGRTATERFTVRVRTAAPMFTELVVPPTAAASREAVRVRVAASRPAELRVRGQRFTVGPRARFVNVRLPRGGPGEVILRLEVRADGRTSKVTAAVTRG